MQPLESMEDIVRSFVQRLHITFPRPNTGGHSTAERDNGIGEKYAGGLNIPKRAREYGVLRACIQQILHRGHR